MNKEHSYLKELEFNEKKFYPYYKKEIHPIIKEIE
jgi:hypothetical protein